MNIEEASAMTEASGLTNEQERATAGDRRPPQSRSQDAAMLWAEWLRKTTEKAPLQSLAVAFVLGMWVARRR